MNHQAVLITRQRQDYSWIPELHKAGFGIYLYPKVGEPNSEELRRLIRQTNPELLLIDVDFRDQTIEFALNVYQSELTRHIWIFFLSNRSSQFPPYHSMLSQGSGNFRYAFRPYGLTEIGKIIGFWLPSFIESKAVEK